ncbi:hypothetical protein [Litoribacter populi]|uniref:hypothetical protein n=1 Tax=Litoribacter populi TaxID=2598460 RepID=UPI00118087FF|nr:hypothetical protein [Litoribacter populi]
MKTQTKKITHIEKVRRENATVKMQVQNALNWDDMQYAQYQEEMGYQYLKAEYGEDLPIVREVVYHKEFWSWWKMHWLKRDRLFLEVAYSMGLDDRLQTYTALHDANDVGFRPHSVILERTYSTMMHRIIKEVMR